ncbi:MAG TPA: hypothetical protein VEF04_05690, partial [Blastocatellia bacterium]|nr:hypothetical protein [Blastocatellia bacterium]
GRREIVLPEETITVPFFPVQKGFTQIQPIIFCGFCGFCQSIRQWRHCLARGMRNGLLQYGQGAEILSFNSGLPLCATQIFAQVKEQPVAVRNSAIAIVGRLPEISIFIRNLSLSERSAN